MESKSELRPTALEIRGMTKAFGENQVLCGIDIDVAEGEVLAVLGPSGSGKSTLLRIATFLETMDEGTLSYFGETALECRGGRNVCTADLSQVRANFGLVFQNFNLFPHWTVLRNVMDAPIHVQKRGREEVREAALELLGRLDLSEKAEQYPGQLSGGQQQRVAIARALALRPRMLYFDEPTSSLDPELTGEILQVIRQLAAERMTMVIVTHEMAFAAEVADRAVFMDGGVVLESGPARQLIESPSGARTRQFLAKLRREATEGG